MSMLAMLAFERGRNAAGGALLGFAVFKIFPGLLGVYLLATRRWRAALWTFGFFLIYSLIAYAEMGPKPFESFVHYELPRIANGEAWAWLENEGLEAVVAINDSVPGAVLKLRQLGVPGMTRGAETIVSWIWTALAVLLTVLAARRAQQQSRLERAASWLAILAVAAFRSPFVPDTYGLFPVVWLWSLVAASALPRTRTIVVLTGLWIALAAVLPFSGMPLPDLLGRTAAVEYQPDPGRGPDPVGAAARAAPRGRGNRQRIGLAAGSRLRRIASGGLSIAPQIP